MTSLYDFSVLNQDHQETLLETYRGKVLLVVNTATGCGLTPQYQGLQELYDRYQEQGFEILDFPCNQFMGQAPGSAEEINAFCSLHYQTTFPRFAKIKVNGKEADPLYVWLKDQKSGPLGKRIEWNGISLSFSSVEMGKSLNASLPKQTHNKLKRPYENYSDFLNTSFHLV